MRYKILKKVCFQLVLFLFFWTPWVQGEKVAWGRKATFESFDGVFLVGRWAKPAKAGKRTWLLLHGLGAGKEEWQAFAKALREQGFGYLSMDLRGHGESRKTKSGGELDYRSFLTSGPGSQWFNMIDDVDAALQFLAQNRISSATAVLAGASIGANIVLNYAARQQSRRNTVVLVSPGLMYAGGLATEAAMQGFSGRAALVVGKGDEYAYKSCLRLNKIQAQTALFVKEASAHGVGLFDGQWEKPIFAWLAKKE